LRRGRKKPVVSKEKAYIRKGDRVQLHPTERQRSRKKDTEDQSSKLPILVSRFEFEVQANARTVL
jgi:hypothetical protein